MRHTAKKLFKSAFSLAAVVGALLLTSFPASAADGASSIGEKGKAVVVFVEGHVETVNPDFGRQREHYDPLYDGLGSQ